MGLKPFLLTKHQTFDKLKYPKWKTRPETCRWWIELLHFDKSYGRGLAFRTLRSSRFIGSETRPEILFFCLEEIIEESRAKQLVGRWLTITLKVSTNLITCALMLHLFSWHEKGNVVNTTAVSVFFFFSFCVCSEINYLLIY